MLTKMTDQQVEAVSGGYGLLLEYPDPFLIEQLQAYKTGLPNQFGPAETYTPPLSE